MLTIPADAGTWSVTLYTSAGDQPLKRMRHGEAFTAVARACPLHARRAAGEPLTGILAMGGTVDRRRRLPADGSVTGLALLADAWACTNPSAGRGRRWRSSAASACRPRCSRAPASPSG